MATTIDGAVDILVSEAYGKLPAKDADQFSADLRALTRVLMQRPKWNRNWVTMNEATLQLDHGCALVTMHFDPTVNMKVFSWRATHNNHFYGTGIEKTSQAACDMAERWLKERING